MQYNQRSENILADNLTPGKYTVIAGTAERGETGSFTLTLKGSDTPLTLIESNTLTAEGAWETTGGGVYNPESLRNHRYTFDVAEDNTTVDVVLESDDTEVALWLLDPLGEQIDLQYNRRSEFTVQEADKGTYTVIAGTTDRNIRQADYRLNVNGKVDNIGQIASQDTIATGTITSGAGVYAPTSPNNHVYTFEVTENNTAIDVIMESPDFDVSLWLYDANGERIGLLYSDRREFIVEEVDSGTYTVICGTTREGDSGNYNLSVVGKFINFARK